MLGDNIVDPDVAIASSEDSSLSSSLRSFIHGSVLLPRLHEFCKSPSEAELNYLQTTLDCYQDASYLLEPHLQRLTEKPLDAFKAAYKLKEDGEPRVPLLAKYLYWLSKVVSPKLIVRYFPHAPLDLSLLLSSISAPTFSDEAWETRYILLLWLSLVINIPFSLTKFGDNVPAQLENIIRHWLSSPGKEREAIATIASKYYARKDVTDDHLNAFLQWVKEQLQTEDADVFVCTGILQFLSTFVKSATRQSFSKEVLSKLYSISALFDPSYAGSGIPNSPLLRRLRAKYQGRLAAAYLPPLQAEERRRTKTRVTMQGSNAGMQETVAANDIDFDVPEQVEALIADLLEMLSDSDSRVRWTTSKALARISSQLPLPYIDQLVSAILETYTGSIIHFKTPSEDLSLVSASTWHGATLCLASFLRNTLLSPDQVRDCIPWVLRGLTFAQRKGAHKIGSNIRDASCYFVWCAARASSKQADLLRDQDVQELAKKLVVVAGTDEEVSVRRAASAAFQECVGRLSNVPHGLDVLVLMDAYIVGSRRSAFLEAAPSISKFEIYGNALEAHLLNKSLPHAEVQIRQLAAISLCKILASNPVRMANIAKQQVASLPAVKQSGVAHGSLLFLAEVAAVTESDQLKLEIYQALAAVPQALLLGSAIALLLPTIAQVTAAALASSTFDTSTVDQKATWKRYIDIAQKRPEPSSHEAAATIIAAVSSRFDCLADLKATLRTLKMTTSFLTQQCVTMMLGSFDYSQGSSCNELLGIVQDRLSKVLDNKNTPSYKSIEAKRNALDSLANVCVENIGDSKNEPGLAMAALRAAREDYTTDERGDVGSWVRMVCMKRSTDMVLAIHNSEEPNTTFKNDTISFLLKQSAERLDNVREEAGQQLGRLLPVVDLLQQNLVLEDWRQLSTVLPQLLCMLPNYTFANELLSGIVTTVGGPLESVQPGTAIFMAWAKTLPIQHNSDFCLIGLLRLVESIVQKPGQSNRVIIPTLQTIAIILEEHELLLKLQESDDSMTMLSSMTALALESMQKSKVQARILASARILMSLAQVPSVQADCLASLADLRDGASSVIQALLADQASHFSTEVQTLLPPLTIQASVNLDGAKEQYAAI